MLKFLKGLKKSRHGFTLVELMAVVVILGILAAFAIPKVMGSVKMAKDKTDNANITTLQSAVERVYTETGSFPSTLEGLKVSGHMRTIPKDPVNDQDYKYDISSGEVTHSGH